MAESINLNHRVRFKLTDDGRKRIAEFDAAMNEICRTPEKFKYDWFRFHAPDAEGFYSEQLWSLMQMFGPDTHMAGPQHFVSNELIYDGDGMQPTPAAGTEAGK